MSDLNSLKKEIDKDLMKIERKVLKEIIKRVKKVLKKENDLEEFVMGMGGAQFSNENTSYLIGHGETKYFNNKDLEEIEFLFEEYNEIFRLTGHGLWINKSLESCFEWSGPNTEKVFKDFSTKEILNVLL